MSERHKREIFGQKYPTRDDTFEKLMSIYAGSSQQLVAPVVFGKKRELKRSQRNKALQGGA